MAVLLAALAFDATAQTYFCERPEPPYFDGTIEGDDVEDPRAQVSDYADRMQEYLDCIELERIDALQEVQDVLETLQDVTRNARGR